MYETEANILTEPVGQIPSEIIAKFAGYRDKVLARTLLPWGEHCTECVWPSCYTSCDLYSPREDGRCRRFVDGMVRLDSAGLVNRYLLKIRFKRWGKLWTPGNIRLVPLADADRMESLDRGIGTALYQLPAPRVVRSFATTKRYVWKKRSAINAKPSPEVPDAFVIECYNPGSDTIAVSLTMRASDCQAAIPFQQLLHLLPGFSRAEVPVKEIAATLDLRAPFGVELVPNEIADGTTLFFGLIDFVALKKEPVSTLGKPRLAKCIVWDLDNTLWDGVLVEDGADKLALKPGIPEVIKELDRRGILHSVASKNNFDEAMSSLRAFGLDDYFLHPQISWAPKSESLKTIARKLNIGLDTLLFIDDSPFELAEVASACPEVQTVEAERYKELPQLPACEVPVTDEGASRRKMYQEEAVRDSAAESFAGDYLAFLRECQIEVRLEPLSQANLERVHELTQRTNQMNFSGNRYERTLLEQVAATPHLDTYVISCRDRFGSYGIVGFSIVDSRELRMTDLMFSCRIQSKRVEHAFLVFLLRKYTQGSGMDFWANYRKTPRNTPSGRVFEDIGLEEVEQRDGVSSLVFRKERAVPEEDSIRIIEAMHAMSSGS